MRLWGRSWNGNANEATLSPSSSSCRRVNARSNSFPRPRRGSIVVCISGWVVTLEICRYAGSQENHVVPALPSKLVRKLDLGSVISAAKVGKQVTKRQPSDRD
ncbi:hypothetical protein PC129_g19950 [Phytophthora cactorum]|uniref:Uncharacterized protein n=1 Tax=Phytophthora cactorum TaxID=29920 RepID=A0A8T1HAG2_9STRA|nr:hypothetical protein PC117_g24339 [Phytophthora cactorum]KAG3054715.1 hypothetical protein PC122_g21935 [Phytophthora cactorum]KAG3209029.1 hypothetical protein PC129_g19950 [Phytophthora cactorum]